jgi:hypothetical protein
VLRLDFDWRVVPQFRGATITSDAGLLPYRELDDAAGLTETSDDMLADARACQRWYPRRPVILPADGPIANQFLLAHASVTGKITINGPGIRGVSGKNRR